MMDSRQCHVCGEVFINISVVTSHISTHSRKEMYECLVAFKSSLEIFMKQYYALKRYVDENLVQHIQRDDSDTGNDTNWSAPVLSQESESLTERRSPADVHYKSESNEMYIISERNKQDRLQIIQKENYVDLTEVEIKKEIDPTDEQFIRSFSEYENINSMHTAEESIKDLSNHNLRGDNLTPNLGGDNLISQQKGNGVSVIDLSRFENKGSHENSSKEVQHTSVQNGNLSIKNGQNHSKEHDITVSNIKENIFAAHQYTESDMDATVKNIKENILSTHNHNQSAINQIQPLSSRTLQMLAKEISLKTGDVRQNFSGTTCLQCGRSFSTKFVLRRHMMSHTGERTHSCPVCGKGFIGKQNMMVHIRVHTGEKPYKCSTCGQQFSQYGTLYRHKKRHLVNGDTRATSSF